ncbi:hypothetical protein DF143_37175 [Burkholderia cenocepacia]|nr:hypothetical protein DF143_37175 [Burkholderia cenocepacia]RQV32008.1 hypothetical protein DF033_36735 [Burkholderia cenocepacia]
MSVSLPGTAFACACNTQTQSIGILGQLLHGARYFDIRPVISAGQYTTGHYTAIAVSGLTTWQGANGQTIDSIVADVNAYTATHSELVVLYLSHDLDTDLGNSAYAPFTQQQWNDLLTRLLQGLNHRFVHDSASDLTMLPLQTFIGTGQAAVIVVVDPSANGINLGSYAGQGFYPASSFPVYNQYADTNDASKMISDQFAKLAAQRPDPAASYFLLSWTLTQTTLQAATCAVGLAPSILQMASSVNALLPMRLLSACTPQSYPNVLYVDGISDFPDLVTLAMQINGLSRSSRR